VGLSIYLVPSQFLGKILLPALPRLCGEGQKVGSRLRSGAAAGKDAELVPLWVGKYDPALIPRLAGGGMPGT